MDWHRMNFAASVPCPTILSHDQATKNHKNRHSAPPWHLLEPWQTTAWLKVDPEKGLDHKEAEERLCRLWPERHPGTAAARGASDFFRAIRRFHDYRADYCRYCIGPDRRFTDTIAIVVIVVLNALIGFIQEYRAEQAVAALKRLASPSAQVLREGNIHTIAAHDLVPGDLVMLEAGNVIPADLSCWMCRGSRLKRPP